MEGEHKIPLKTQATTRSLTPLGLINYFMYFYFKIKPEEDGDIGV